MTNLTSADLATTLDTQFASIDLAARLRLLRERVAGRIVFTTSLGLEDQVITHAIASAALDIEIVTLDTGRLFAQTYALWSATEARYGIRIGAIYPERVSLEALVRDQGIDGFYVSLAARKACCDVRKVEPLARALKGASAWITGLRADQSQTRAQTAFVAVDGARALIKANPLLDWPRDAALAFARANDVPINALHDQGFLSIGCAPCTRALHPGEDERAGRWWWESDAQKECGLHVGPGGRLTRTPQPPRQPEPFA